MKNLYLLLIFSLTVGCQSQTFGNRPNDPFNKGVCTSQATMKASVEALNRQHATLFAQSASLNKVDPEDFSAPGTKILSTHSVVKAGTDMIVAVNRQCALEHSQSLPSSQLVGQLNTSQNFEKMRDQSLLWKLEKDYSIAQLAEVANSNSCILALSPNKPMEPTTVPNDEHYSKQSHLAQLHFESVFDKLFGNASNVPQTIVAIIDTGDKMDHPDMQGRFWINAKEKNGQAGTDDDGNGFVDDVNGWDFTTNSGTISPSYQIHHAEHVGGLIAANANNGVGVVGLASSRAKIMNINVFEMLIPGSGQTDPMIKVEQGIRYAADSGAQVANLSLGGTGVSTTMKSALDYAVNKGVLVVAAAGNNSQEISDSYKFIPAYYAKGNPGMIAVGATDSSPSASQLFICSFSNFSSSFVEISAPGCDSQAPQHGLLSLERIGSNDPAFPYAYMPGTSMATPLVVAASAVAISYIKEKSGVTPTNAVVKQIIKNSALSKDSLNDKIENNRALDIPTMIAYIDKEILHINCP